MKTPYFTIKDIMQITGVTKRALHYYDKTDLLKPSKIEANGYRLYDQEALGNLQTILLFKEMKFSLKDIATMMKLSKDEQKEILRASRYTRSTKTKARNDHRPVGRGCEWNAYLSTSTV